MITPSWLTFLPTNLGEGPSLLLAAIQLPPVTPLSSVERSPELVCAWRNLCSIPFWFQALHICCPLDLPTCHMVCGLWTILLGPWSLILESPLFLISPSLALWVLMLICQLWGGNTCGGIGSLTPDELTDNSDDPGPCISITSSSWFTDVSGAFLWYWPRVGSWAIGSFISLFMPFSMASACLSSSTYHHNGDPLSSSSSGRSSDIFVEGREPLACTCSWYLVAFLFPILDIGFLPSTGITSEFTHHASDGSYVFFFQCCPFRSNWWQYVMSCFRFVLVYVGCQRCFGFK